MELIDRVRELIAPFAINVEEKKMFGGTCFMVNDKMCMCVKPSRIMVRINPNIYAEALLQDGCTPMEMKGKPLIGYVFVDAGAVNTKTKLNYWVKLALEYNPIATASKKKKK